MEKNKCEYCELPEDKCDCELPEDCECKLPEDDSECKVPTEKDRLNSLKESIERDRKGVFISFAQFKKEVPIIAKWFNFLYSKNKMHIFKLNRSNSVYKIIFVSTNYEYYITVNIKDGKDSYLGCICSCRSAYPGETWTRGSDFPDGKLKHTVFQKIINAIVRNELLPLVEVN